jgi:RimJ/RimL family protein N-acetyltransferase
MAGFPPLDEPLTDGVIALRPATERDIPETLIAYQDDPELHLRLGIERVPSSAELGRAYEQADAEWRAGIGCKLTILRAGSEVCRGQIHAHHIDWENERAELGMWVAPQLRGQRLGSRALRLATRWLLEHCGLERIEVLTEPDNEAMVRTARAAGFQPEGVLRGYFRYHCERGDSTVLSAIRADLPG